ncbi:MAG: PQQ-binding-like beta-propeller repeat protein, partial [Acidobacteria bacterium]|nr:PQQ-binding-like beta-propeller repeat protein [Acidobacteriota bacterium]
MPQPRFSAPALLVAATAASFALGVSTAQAQPAGEFVPVTDAMLQDPDPADWPMWRRTLDGWGYSPLDQVNRDNVGELQMAWSRALPQGTQEVTPLAYDGVVYMPTLTDIIQALDATNGDLIWEYRRDLPDDVYEFVGGNARSMRNIAIYDRQIINISDDDYAYALDVETGDVVWETRIFDYQETPAGHSSGPIIADGRVISGRSCRPRGGPESCVLVAHDARTGEELWRRRTVPAPGEPGDETWGGVPYERRGDVGSWASASDDPPPRPIFPGTSV